MIEIPEAAALAEQTAQALIGKTIERVIAAASPHKFAWFHGDPAGYHDLLCDMGGAVYWCDGCQGKGE
jgi:formamidopyrimidine-DNA glycosylase